MEDKDIFKCLELMNETNIEYKRKSGKDYSNDIKIQELLEDKEVFFKISKEKAYKILNELGINNIDEVYRKLKNK